MIDLTFNMINNDCELISDDENMIASSIRRLNTMLESTLYDTYGSNLKGLLGLRKSDVNLQFLNHSIIECLMQDKRITNCKVDCEYTVNGILADINMTYEDNELEFDFELTGDD